MAEETQIMNAAQQLQDAISASPEFKQLKMTFDSLKADTVAYKTFQDFQANQNELRQKQMSGQQISEDDMKKAQSLAKEMETLPIIKTLMEKEKAMGQVIDDANMVITKPLRDMYQD